MQSVFQEDEFGCGIACVAMLCGTSYKKAKKICGASYVPGDGIYEAPMLGILNDHGFSIVKKGRITQKAPVTSLKRHALLWVQQLPSRGTIVRPDNVDEHWAVWDSEAQVVRDPYRYKKPFWVTKFFELEVIQ